MGWPRKTSEMSLYREAGGAYLLVLAINGANSAGCYGAIANAHSGSSPSLAGVGVSPGYLRSCRRVGWNELPAEWKKALARYMRQGGDTFNPRKVRGFFRIGENNADHVRRRQVRRGEQQRHPHGVPAR